MCVYVCDKRERKKTDRERDRESESVCARVFVCERETRKRVCECVFVCVYTFHL